MPNPQFFDNAPTTSESYDAGVGTEDYSGSTKFENMKEWFKVDQQHSQEWRVEAKECYDFVAGTQWSEEDMAYLKDAMRPAITFNRIEPMVNSVSGLEVNNRQETKYFPRQIGAAGVSELLTDADKYFRDECQAEDEESHSFVDLLTSGMGWTNSLVKYDEDQDGMPVIERIDPIEMYWDASARKKNLIDGRRVWRLKDIPMSEAEDMFPNHEIEDINAMWAIDADQLTNDPHNAQQAPFYRNDQSGKENKGTTLVRLVELQWWEKETVYRMIDPMTGQETTMDAKGYKNFRSNYERLQKAALEMGKYMPDPQVVKQKAKKYWKAFLGSEILSIVPGPETGGFTYKAMTGRLDRNRGIYHGIVRAMLDPQRWANKWLSQGMHIMNTNAQGGIMAKKDAFDNPQAAAQGWARDPITWMKKNVGSIGDSIMPKPPVNFPAEMTNLMTFAISSIRDVSGINLELLGQADRDQPGILEHQRKQAAMTVLAGYFDSLRRYRKSQGKLMLFYISKFCSDGRLIRIGGQETAQYVPLVKQPDTIKYDVVVDDTPNSVNSKETAWAAITQMLPSLERQGLTPQMWLLIAQYSPLPPSFVSDFTKLVQQQQQQPKPPDPKLQIAQLGVQSKQLDLQGKQIDAQIQQSEAQDSRMHAQIDLQNAATDAQKAKADADVSFTGAILNLAKAWQIKQGMNIDQVNTAIDAATASHNIRQDAENTRDQRLQTDKSILDSHHKAKMDQVNAAMQQDQNDFQQEQSLNNQGENNA